MARVRAVLTAICAVIATYSAGSPVVAQPVPLAEPASSGESPDGRVARLARRLLIANVSQCPQQRWDFGFTAHRNRLPGASGPAEPPGGPAEPDGFRVTQVVPLTSAARAGLRLGDRIVAVNSEDWRTRSFAATFLRAEHADPGVKQLVVMADRGSGAVTATVDGELACAIPVRLVPQAKINASAASGMAFINSGLEQALPQDDQLAAVISHEIAHVLLGHSKRDTTSTDRARMEREADALGVRLALRAGFEPDGAARATEAIGRRGRGPISRLLGLYGDHMPTPERKTFLLEQSAAARREQQVSVQP